MRTRWYMLAAVLLGLDRLTKSLVAEHFDLGDELVILPVFSLVRWHNEGAAFSFLNDAGGWQTYALIALAAGFSLFLIWEIARLKAHEHLLGFTYSAILAGALGNLWGRADNGYVIDFVLVHYQDWYFPAFNVADSAIFLGACGWIYMIIKEMRDQRLSKANS